MTIDNKFSNVQFTPPNPSTFTLASIGLPELSADASTSSRQGRPAGIVWGFVALLLGFALLVLHRWLLRRNSVNQAKGTA